ncbi:MAG: DUF47 family protein [archaeon]|nr:DUF47 family protein [archaeon]
MGSLMEYFKSRNQEKIITKIDQHMKKVLESVTELEKGLVFLLEDKNIDLALKVFYRVGDLEHQADTIRRDILASLSKAELLPVIRENVSQLAKKIDDVANSANACARILVYMKHNDFFKLDKEIHSKMLEMASVSGKAAKELNLMLITMNNTEYNENDKLQDMSKSVNVWEHNSDELHFAINRTLVKKGQEYEINPFSAQIIMNAITELENITDNAEEVADYIVTLALSSRRLM